MKQKKMTCQTRTAHPLWSVEFTASELTERAQDPEHDEDVNVVIEIDTEEEENEENEEDAMEAAATGIDLVNDDTEYNKAQGYRGGEGNLEQENLVIDEDDETDEVVVITKATEESTEDDAHNEVVEIDPDTEKSTNISRGRSLRRSMRRVQQSPSPVRPQSPQRVKEELRNRQFLDSFTYAEENHSKQNTSRKDNQQASRHQL